jgi:hypothetical protein
MEKFYRILGKIAFILFIINGLITIYFKYIIKENIPHHDTFGIWLLLVYIITNYKHYSDK